MASENLNAEFSVSYNQLFSESTNQFLGSIENIEIDEISKGLELNFEIRERLRNQK